MPLDPSIIAPNTALLQSIANPQPIPTIADIQAKQLALQNARLQSQSNVLDIQQKQREMDAQQAIDTAMSGKLKQNPDGTMSFDHEAIANDLTQRGFGHLVPALQESWTKADQAKATLNKTNGDIAELQQKAQAELRDHMGLLAQGISDQNNDPQAAIAAIGHADIDPAKAQALVQQIQAHPTPEFVKSIIDPIRAQSPAVQKLLTDRMTAAARQKTADTGAARFDADKPKIAADTITAQQKATEAQADAANRTLTAAAALGPAALQAAAQQQPKPVQDILASLGPNPTAPQVHRALLAPKDQDTYDNLKSEEKSRQVANAIAQGHLNVAQQDLKLKQMYAPPATTPGAANLTGEDFLKTLPPSQGNLLRQMGNGDIPPPPPGSRSQIAQQQLQALTQYDPTFNSNRFNTMKDFSTGSAHKSVNAVNTAITHLELLQQAGHAMHNGSFVPGNALYNAFVNEFGSPEPSNFDNIMQRVSGELNKATGSNGEKEMEAIKKNLNRSGSNAEIDGAVKTNIQLLGGAMDSNKQDYMRGTGFPEDHPKVQALLSPRAKQALANIGFDQNMNPLPKAAAADVQAARQQYKHVATMPNGDLIGSNDGKTWVDTKSGKKVQ